MSKKWREILYELCSEFVLYFLAEKSIYNFEIILKMGWDLTKLAPWVDGPLLGPHVVEQLHDFLLSENHWKLRKSGMRFGARACALNNAPIPLVKSNVAFETSSVNVF